MKTLRQLFVDFPFYYPPDLSDVPVGGISIDSRQVKGGDLFVAMRGGSSDGHRFIPHAIQNGASCIVGDEPVEAGPVPYIQVADARQALSWLTAAFYDWPARKLTMIGITGTDGKTTTSNILFQILRAAGLQAGMISTVNAVIGSQVLDTGFHVTTPDAHNVQDYLSRMVEAGATHAILETTSHGWAQHRVDACEFDIGVVTNITHEHLDEHGSYENYRAAKARLFSSLEITRPKSRGNPRLAILNRDDASFPFLDAFARVNKINYGLSEGADLRAVEIREDRYGTQFYAATKDLRVAIESTLLGKYNISNCLAALAAAVFGAGIAPEAAASGIAAFSGVPGRMESIDMGQDFTAIVDFAHTPNALKVTLEEARRILGLTAKTSKAKPRLISVFGSAGLRDRAKRRLMAETSVEFADLSIFTAEDPRTESLSAILDEMGEAASARMAVEGKTFWRISDRGEAIKFAVSLARAGDIVLACGKGHEQSMCFGVTEYPWDDRIAMKAALAGHLGIAGPEMPYLPSRDRSEAEWLR